MERLGAEAKEESLKAEMTQLGFFQARLKVLRKSFRGTGIRE